MVGARHASSDPYTMPMSARIAMGMSRLLAPSGKIGTPTRSRPYTPALLMSAAMSAVTTMGAWLYAMGSHPWKGHSGSLMAKASTNPANSRVLAVLLNGTPCRSLMRNDRCPMWSRAIIAVLMMATSMMRLPTIV